MLRNMARLSTLTATQFLNEVLSLNAQEFVERKLAADFVVNPQ